MSFTAQQVAFIGGTMSGVAISGGTIDNAAITNVSTGSGIGAPWTDYTPTVSALAGTLTTVSATGRFQQVGKTIYFSIAVTITNAGTASTGILATLPVNAISRNFAFGGRENALTGVSLASTIAGVSNSQVLIQKYDGTYIGSAGQVLVVSGSYEAA